MNVYNFSAVSDEPGTEGELIVGGASKICSNSPKFLRPSATHSLELCYLFLLMEDPMLIVTRIAYGVPEGPKQLDTYIDEALENYGLAIYAHMCTLRDTIERFKSDPTEYRSNGLASITERLEASLKPFLDLDREFARYERPLESRSR